MLGRQWKDKLFVETALPFGVRSAPKLLLVVADALQWIDEQERVLMPAICYLDDFLFVGPPRGPICALSIQSFLSTCDHLGVLIAWEKLKGSTSMLTFLGIETDAVAIQLSLPLTKLRELRDLIREWKAKPFCRREELESLGREATARLCSS